MRIPHASLAGIVAGAMLTTLPFHVAVAQDLGWRVQLDGAASLFFGASSQRTALGAGSIAHRDSSFEGETQLQVRYGEVTDTSGVSTVNSRAWLASLSLDVRPFARVSPFLFGSVESSLEKRLAQRSSGGAGARFVVQRDSANEWSVSGAVLGEYERPSAGDGDPRSLVRLSLRLKGHERVGRRLTLTQVSFYQPEAAAFARYVVTTTTELAYSVTSALGLTVSVLDNYDSQARTRGAPSNNDGQLLFGVKAHF